MLRVFRVNLGTRLYSVKTAKKDAHKYTDTINLPRTKFPNRLTAAKREEQERQTLEVGFAAQHVFENFIYTENLFDLSAQDLFCL